MFQLWKAQTFCQRLQATAQRRSRTLQRARNVDGRLGSVAGRAGAGGFSRGSVKAATGHWYGSFSESSDRTVLSSLQTPCTISPSASNDTHISPQRSSAPKKETPQENPDSVEPIRQAVDPPQECVDKRKVSASPRSLPLPGLRTLHKPYSVKWTRARLQDAKPERVTGILRAWIHPRRYQEATPEVIAKINCLEDDAAVSALE